MREPEDVRAECEALLARAADIHRRVQAVAEAAEAEVKYVDSALEMFQAMKARIAELEALAMSQAERIHAQSELLSRAAAKGTT